MAAKGITKIEEKEVITAIFKVNLHCQQCALDIKNPLLKTEGVQNVEVDNEKGEIKVKGRMDIIKVHKIIERVSKKRVVLISPQPKTSDTQSKNIRKEKEAKQETTRTITIKVHMHCDKCEVDLRKKLLKHRGIYMVKTDMKTQTLTVQGTIECDKLLAYIRKKAQKSATVVETDTKEKKATQTQVTKLVESSEVIKEEENNSKEGSNTNTPYFIHYVYAPQLFSDENPNACFIL
ncbi:hypothetical protein K2173_024330 [Erythroxylum novogranatense]|uniref:HMA domain-containing protein n=1 Tax=Erythroxylum novogranatense TaxID=1862640 RepID=A0AAV8S6J2_9ROSI|nr:hypothetical protein K2173_024330 [Erythroxylum novogranatense]